MCVGSDLLILCYIRPRDPLFSRAACLFDRTIYDILALIRIITDKAGVIVANCSIIER